MLEILVKRICNSVLQAFISGQGQESTMGMETQNLNNETLQTQMLII